MKVDLNSPVENRDTIVKTNTKTNEPYVLFKLFNVSDKVIDTVCFDAKIFDENGAELGSVPVELSELSGQPKSFFASNKAVSLASFPQGKHITAEFSKIVFEGGEEYIPDPENFTDVVTCAPDDGDFMKLTGVCGEDAVCYAKDEGSYYVCVCGRANNADEQNCVRCGRSKDEVLTKFSDIQGVESALAQKVIDDKIHTEEEQQRLLEEKKAKNKKILKTLAVIGIIIVILAIVTGVGILVKNPILNAIAGSKVKNGDYLSAYGLYAQTGSEKIGEVSESVRGNSSSNSSAAGILTEDDENYYFIDSSFAIFKQSKKDGNRTQLGTAKGQYLNVVGDYLYYISLADKNNIMRIKTDGTKEAEAVTDFDVVNLQVIGNTLYYSTVEMPEADSSKNKDPNATQNPYDAQAQQSASYPLYSQKIGSKHRTKIADESPVGLVVYKNSIFYINTQDNYSLNKMDLNGKNSAKILDGPVVAFDVYNDKIFYVDGSTNEDSGNYSLALKSTGLDGSDPVSVLEGKQIVYFNISDDVIYYLDYSDEKMYAYPLDGGEVNPVMDTPVYIYNVSGLMMVYLNSNGELFLDTIEASNPESLGSIYGSQAQQGEAPQTEEIPSDTIAE